MSPTVETLRELPWSAHALAGIALVGGVVLCWIGERALRPVILILFALAGGLAGLSVATLTTAGESLGPLGGLLVGMVAGGAVGLFTWRVAMAVGVGLVLGLAAPMATMILLEATDPRGDDPPAARATVGERYGRSLETYNELVAGLAQSTRDAAKRGGEDDSPENVRSIAQDAVQESADNLLTFGGAVRDDLNADWNSLPVRHRLAVGVAGIGGLVLGFLMGLALPRWAAGAATSMLGAAIAIPSAAWLLCAAGAPWTEHLCELTPRGWLAIWMIASAVGTAWQWKRARSGPPAGAPHGG